MCIVVRYNEALRYALGAEGLLDVAASRGADEYTDTIVSRAIDAYVRHRNRGRLRGRKGRRKVCCGRGRRCHSRVH